MSKVIQVLLFSINVSSDLHLKVSLVLVICQLETITNIFYCCLWCPDRNTDALMHVVKASLGSGILAMPDAFKNCGLLFGVVGTALVALLCTHGTALIVSNIYSLLAIRSKITTTYTLDKLVSY